MPRWSAEKPAVAVVATGDDYDEGYHKGNVGGLDAVDTDLAPGNIKDAVTIFGKLGTFVGGPLVEDILGSTILDDETIADTGTYFIIDESVPAESTVDLVTITQGYAPTSRAIGMGFFFGRFIGADLAKFQLVMAAVQVAESDYIFGGISYKAHVIMGTRALAGSQAVLLRVKSWSVSPRALEWATEGHIGNKAGVSYAVAAGSIKT